MRSVAELVSARRSPYPLLPFSLEIVSFRRDLVGEVREYLAESAQTSRLT